MKVIFKAKDFPFLGETAAIKVAEAINRKLDEPDAKEKILRASEDRYRLMMDRDGHQFLVTLTRSDLFTRLCNEAYERDFYGKFDQEFGKDRIDNFVAHYTFTDPRYLVEGVV